MEYCEKSNLSKMGSTVELKRYLNHIDPSTMTWNKAQSWIYTDGLHFAEPAAGLEDLLRWLNNNNYEITIHSHKTKETPQSSGSLNLRTPMEKWFKTSILAQYLNFSSQVHFYESKDEKIEGIRKAQLDIFVDDLIEIFLHPRYPHKIQSFLIGNENPDIGTVKHFVNFKDMTEWIQKNDTRHS
jgi:hypothetical protein